MKLSNESPKARQQYHFGKVARLRGFARKTNPNLDDVQAKHWWLAGWMA